jgi:hypothetical protein
VGGAGHRHRLCLRVPAQRTHRIGLTAGAIPGRRFCGRVGRYEDGTQRSQVRSGSAL